MTKDGQTSIVQELSMFAIVSMSSLFSTDTCGEQI